MRFAPAYLAIILAAIWGAWAAAAHAGAPGGWLPIDPEDLSRRAPVAEPGADAEAIFWKGWIDDVLGIDSIDQECDYYTRVKIFTDRGAQTWSQVNLDYPDADVEVRSIQARTIEPDGTIVPVGNEAISRATRIESQGEIVMRRSIAMPQVRAGSIVEYRYHKHRTGYTWDRDFRLQLDYPVRSLSYYLRPLSVPGWHLRQMVLHSTASFGAEQADGYFEITAANVPAFRAEPLSPPVLQQLPWMLLYYSDQDLMRPEAFWQKAGRTESDWFDRVTRPDGDARDLAGSIAGVTVSDTARVRLLTQWVQREIKVCRDPDSLRAQHIGRNGNARAVLRRRAGTPLDADVALACLARAAGLEVHLLRVPTRRHCFFDPNMMDLQFLPSFEVAVRVTGGWLSVNPGSAYLPWDMVPWDESAQNGLLCDGSGSEFIELPAPDPRRSQVARTATFTLDEDGTLDGELETTVSGYLNSELRTALEHRSGVEVDSTLTWDSPWGIRGMGISHVEWVRGEDPRTPLRVRCHVSIPQAAVVTSKRIVLSPNVFHASEPSRFPASERRDPVYLPFGWSELDTVSIRLVKGWKVEALDPARPVDAPGFGGYECRILDGGDAVLTVRRLIVGENGAQFVPAAGYPELKQFFDLVSERDRATIALVRQGTTP